MSLLVFKNSASRVAWRWNLLAV